MEILTKVLLKIKPTHKEEEKLKGFIKRLSDVARDISGIDPVLVGSTAKMTWLSGDHDIDLFIPLPKDFSRKDLEKTGLELGKSIASKMKGKYKIKYAEHPYVSAEIQGFTVDIVPCYKISMGEKIISAVDRSPLHQQFLVENIKPHMLDSIRLLKQFCKGIGVYGSDVKNQGFSGYICELLVLR